MELALLSDDEALPLTLLLPGGGRALEEDEEALVLFPSTTEELDMVRPDPLPWSLPLLLFFFATCARRWA